jgi:hypothetical protein
VFQALRLERGDVTRKDVLTVVQVLWVLGHQARPFSDVELEAGRRVQQPAGGCGGDHRKRRPVVGQASGVRSRGTFWNWFEQRLQWTR